LIGLSGASIARLLVDSRARVCPANDHLDYRHRPIYLPIYRAIARSSNCSLWIYWRVCCCWCCCDGLLGCLASTVL